MPNYISTKQINQADLSGFFVDSISSESGLLLDFAERAASAVLLSGFTSGVIMSGNLQVSGTGIFNSLDLNNIDNLSLSGVDVAIRSGNVTLTNRPTVNGTGVLLSGQNSFIINLYNTSDTQAAGNNFFGNIAAGFSATAGGVNIRFPVLEACVVRRATWTQYNETVGSPSLNSTGYFINTTTSTTGIISTTINTQSTTTPTHYIAEFSPPIRISAGDYIVCNLFSPTYATTFPATVRNSVNLYCYN